MASRETRIKRAIRATYPLAYLYGIDGKAMREIVKRTLDSAGLPDIMAAKEVQETLGVTDLRKVAGLPESEEGVSAAPRLWEADKIKALARERQRSSNPYIAREARRRERNGGS